MSNRLAYKGYHAMVSFDAEDRILVGRIVGINDVIGFHADSLADIEAAFHEAVDDYLETCARIGKEPEREYSGRFLVRLDPATHARVATAAELLGRSINQFSEDALREKADRVLTG